MHALKARVRSGRLVLDEPTNLPEGTELELMAFDEGDDLDEAERRALHESIQEGLADVAAGRVVDAAIVLAELRGRA